MNKVNKNDNIRQLVFSAMCLAMCIMLPFLTAQLPQVGKLMSPMHLPVLLCGMICSWYWGAAIGFAAPILRCLMFGMPMMVNAIPMAFELCVYGACAGILYAILPKKVPYIYVSLAGAMIAGRIVWIIATFICIVIGFSSRELSFSAFLITAFGETWVGIIIQFLIIPPVVMAMRRVRLVS